MAWTRTKLLLLCAAVTLSASCGDDDSDDDQNQTDAGDAGKSQNDGGRDAASDAGNIDAGDAGKLDAGGDSGRSDAGVSPLFSFFVTSDSSPTGNLGGLAAADQRCQRLATAVGAGNKTWRAYLSVERNPANNDQPTEARTRIGSGPWYNVRGLQIAPNLSALHERTGDAELFLTEQGQKVNGQWPGSPRPVEHDILTGTAIDGGVAFGATCGDWTLSDAGIAAVVGHSDGLGPDASTAGQLSSWFSSHQSAGCNDTAPRGGAGKLYCFAVNP